MIAFVKRGGYNLNVSGHNKWSKIHRAKGIADQRKGREFSKLSQAISLAVRAGKSGDAQMNPSLRTYLEKAREMNMPKENVQRAIDRGLGKGEGGAALEEVIYEGYGPGGVAFMVLTSTTNRNRSLMEIKNVFDKFGGSLGSPGSAAYAFVMEDGQYKPTLRVPVDVAVGEKIDEMVAMLEEDEDVDQVATNEEKA